MQEQPFQSQPQPPVAQPIQPIQPNQKKSNGALIGIIVGVLVCVIVGLVVFFVVRGGNGDGNSNTNNQPGGLGSAGGSQTTNNPADDDSAYTITINGKTFNNQSTIAEVEASGYKMREAAKDTTIPAGKYMLLIGGSKLTDSSTGASIDFTSYNDSDADVKISDAKLGKVTVSYGVSDEKNAFVYEGITFYGGIHLGSTEEELKNVFGEPYDQNEYTDYKNNPYTKYEFRGKVYQNFTFNVTDGKVTEISWTNYGTLAD